MDWSLTSPARNGSWPFQAKSEEFRSCFYRSQELQEFRSCRMGGISGCRQKFDNALTFAVFFLSANTPELLNSELFDSYMNQ
jgi:hypothetical protein